jgi:hypothetical protein
MLTRSKTILVTTENDANSVGFVFKDGDAGAVTSTKSTLEEFFPRS